MAAYDVWTCYHATAEGYVISTNPLRRPVVERTTTNKNIAMVYAVQTWLKQFTPSAIAAYNGQMVNLGLDPNLVSNDLTTPEGNHPFYFQINIYFKGLGVHVGNKVYQFTLIDGMNKKGDYLRTYNLHEYEDWTNYYPVNAPWPIPNPSPELLNDPNRWVPLEWNDKWGTFSTQVRVGPQLAYRSTWSIGIKPRDPSQFCTPGPHKYYKNNKKKSAAYINQVEETIQLSAGLTNEQKAMAEFFDDKIRGYGIPANFLSTKNGFNLDKFMWVTAAREMILQDALSVAWYQKRLHDAIRPTTAIYFLKGGKNITAWAGPGQGTKTYRALDWRSYIPTDFHDEYVSGSTCLCEAQAQYLRLIHGSDSFGYILNVTKGTSSIEPGFGPTANVSIPFPTLTDWAQKCGMSRQWAGVHFAKSVADARVLCPIVGTKGYETALKYMMGTITPSQKMKPIPRPPPGGIMIGNLAGPASHGGLGISLDIKLKK